MSQNRKGSTFKSRNSPTSVMPAPTGDFGVEMVDIYVGQGRRHFRVHRQQLCRHVKTFDRMFNRALGCRESIENMATLPEDEPKVFEMFVAWLYSGSLPPVLRDGSDDGLRAVRCAGTLRTHLYCFAEKYLITDLLNTTMDGLCRLANFDRLWLSTSDIEYAYRNSKPGSKLRRFFARALELVISEFAEPEKGTRNAWDSEALSTLLGEHYELCVGIIRLLRSDGERQMDTRATELYLMGCEFYVHPCSDGVHECEEFEQQSKYL